MSKEELRRAIIAALLGAAVTFLTHLAESLAGMNKEMTANVIGGASASVAYLKMAYKSLV
jgi:hypothetical protein